METDLMINARNKAAINRLITSIEGGSACRTIGFDDIQQFCKTAESSYPMPRDDLMGTEVYADLNADTEANGPMSTQFRAVKTRAGWRLTEIVRDYNWKTPYRGVLKYSDRARNHIVNDFSRME